MRFEVHWEGELPAAPDAVWDALTRHTKGWLWDVTYEPRVGGAERGLNPDGGVVTAWEPARHLQTRSNDGTNEVDAVLERRGDRTYLRYRHCGVAADHTEVDACGRHTDFYNHSLGACAQHFAGRDATYVSVDAPDASADDGFATLMRVLGIPEDVAVGDEVTFGGFAGVVDYANDAFLGVRSADGLHRVYGRSAWGWPVAVTHHLFDPAADAAAVQATWKALLDGAFAKAVA